MGKNQERRAEINEFFRTLVDDGVQKLYQELTGNTPGEISPTKAFDAVAEYAATDLGKSRRDLVTRVASGVFNWESDFGAEVTRDDAIPFDNYIALANFATDFLGIPLKELYSAHPTFRSIVDADSNLGVELSGESPKGPIKTPDYVSQPDNRPIIDRDDLWGGQEYTPTEDMEGRIADSIVALTSIWDGTPVKPSWLLPTDSDYNPETDLSLDALDVMDTDRGVVLADLSPSQQTEEEPAELYSEHQSQKKARVLRRDSKRDEKIRTRTGTPRGAEGVVSEGDKFSKLHNSPNHNKTKRPRFHIPTNAFRIPANVEPESLEDMATFEPMRNYSERRLQESHKVSPSQYTYPLIPLLQELGMDVGEFFDRAGIGHYSTEQSARYFPNSNSSIKSRVGRKAKAANNSTEVSLDEKVIDKSEPGLVKGKKYIKETAIGPTYPTSVDSFVLADDRDDGSLIVRVVKSLDEGHETLYTFEFTPHLTTLPSGQESIDTYTVWHYKGDRKPTGIGKDAEKLEVARYIVDSFREGKIMPHILPLMDYKVKFFNTGPEWTDDNEYTADNLDGVWERSKEIVELLGYLSREDIVEHIESGTAKPSTDQVERKLRRSKRLSDRARMLQEKLASASDGGTRQSLFKKLRQTQNQQMMQLKGPYLINDVTVPLVTIEDSGNGQVVAESNQSVAADFAFLSYFVSGQPIVQRAETLPLKDGDQPNGYRPGVNIVNLCYHKFDTAEARERSVKLDVATVLRTGSLIKDIQAYARETRSVVSGLNDADQTSYQKVHELVCDTFYNDASTREELLTHLDGGEIGRSELFKKLADHKIDTIINTYFGSITRELDADHGAEIKEYAQMLYGLTRMGTSGSRERCHVLQDAIVFAHALDVFDYLEVKSGAPIESGFVTDVRKEYQIAKKILGSNTTQ